MPRAPRPSYPCRAHTSRPERPPHGRRARAARTLRGRALHIRSNRCAAFPAGRHSAARFSLGIQRFPPRQNPKTPFLATKLREVDAVPVRAGAHRHRLREVLCISPGEQQDVQPTHHDRSSLTSISRSLLHENALKEARKITPERCDELRGYDGPPRPAPTGAPPRLAPTGARRGARHPPRGRHQGRGTPPYPLARPAWPRWR